MKQNKFRGKGIFENDISEDAIDMIGNICNVELDRDISAIVLQEKQTEIFDICLKSDMIYMQTLGYLLVVYGCVIEEHIKDKIIECCESDEYAKINIERLYIMRSLIDIIRNYDNTPKIIKLNKSSSSRTETLLMCDIIRNLNLPCIKNVEIITDDLLYNQSYAILIEIDSTIETDYEIFEDAFPYVRKYYKLI